MRSGGITVFVLRCWSVFSNEKHEAVGGEEQSHYDPTPEGGLRCLDVVTREWGGT